jgi:hypothetical protein
MIGDLSLTIKPRICTVRCIVGADSDSGFSIIAVGILVIPKHKEEATDDIREKGERG